MEIARLISVLFAVAFLFAATPIHAHSAILQPEVQALDLETGTIFEAPPGKTDIAAGADIRIAWHADRTPHAVVMLVGQGAGIAYLKIAYDNVTVADIVLATFSAESQDRPYDHSTTVLVRTADGTIHKLGKPMESEGAVGFDYARLQ